VKSARSFALSTRHHLQSKEANLLSETVLNADLTLKINLRRGNKDENEPTENQQEALVNRAHR